MTCTDFNQLAKEIHADCVTAGWWADMNRPIRRTLMLVISELSEAMEGDRKNLMDDHLPHRKMLEVELADACIRMLDLGGRYGWTYDLHVQFPLKCSTPEYLFALCSTVIEIETRWDWTLMQESDGVIQMQHMNYEYSSFLIACEQLCRREGLDLFAAIAEKREYNRNRADHKPEARASINGKKY